MYSTRYFSFNVYVNYVRQKSFQHSMVLRIHASVHENPKIYEFKKGEKKTEI